MIPSPVIDSRVVHAFLEQAEALAEKYLPGWKGIGDDRDPAYRLLVVFSRLLEILYARLNRLPEKSFLDFLEFVGVKRFPGGAAEVPVTFKISRKQSPGSIPAGTQVSTAQSKTVPAKVFETRRTFDASPAEIKRVVYLDPANGTYGELPRLENPPPKEVLTDTQGGLPLFVPGGGSDAYNPLDHFLYLESETAFGRKEAATVTLIFRFDGPPGEGFAPDSLEWELPDADGRFTRSVAAAYPASVPNELRADLEMPASLGEAEAGGEKGFWIRIRSDAALSPATGPSMLREISAFISAPPGAEAGVDGAAYNTSPLDTTKPFHPFGTLPRYGDAFYLRCDGAFSDQVEGVEMRFTLNSPSATELINQFANLVAATEIISTVTWQYPVSDKEWKTLEIFRHTYSISPGSPPTILETWVNGTFFAHPETGQSGFAFTIPSDFTRATVNGEEGGWIRALLTSNHPYGKPAEVVRVTPATANDPPYAVVGPTLVPPVVESIAITYDYRLVPHPVSKVRVEENFAGRAAILDGAEPLALFRSPSQVEDLPGGNAFFAESPALYIGFDRDFENRFLSLYARVLEAPFAVGSPVESGGPQLVWEGLGSDGVWAALAAEDETGHLSGRGTIAFLSPKQGLAWNPFQSTATHPQWEEPLYWVRARLAEGFFTLPPVLLGLYPNTVMADQVKTAAADVILGSGSGSKHQTLQLLQVPLLQGELWIREPETPSLLETEVLEEDHRRFTEPVPEGGIIEPVEGGSEAWVRWVETPNFLTSGPNSRHYTLDPVSGMLRFGDAVNGRLPPALKDNVVMRQAKTGGGRDAKQAGKAMAVKELQANLPFVEKVYNVDDAVGGSDAWDPEQLQTFGPQAIKNRGKAISSEDFEWMTLQRFSQLARVKCLPTRAPSGAKLAFRPGAITVLVLPDSPAAEPRPSRGLLLSIEAYLKENALANLYGSIHAMGPEFVPVSLEVRAKAVNLGESKKIEGLIRSEIERFLHPTRGGEDGAGWPFGRAIPKSELMACLQRLEGVEYVQSVTFLAPEGTESIAIPEHALPVSGVHTLEMVGTV